MSATAPNQLPPQPRYVTKYVSREVYDDVKLGKIRVGTLAEYRHSENKEARFGDAVEGVWDEVVRGPIESFTGYIGGNWYSNCKFGGGAGSAIRVNNLTDAYVFCSSIGAYDASHHAEMISRGNPSLVCYVVFDTEKLVEAIKATIADLDYPESGLLWSQAVEYSDEPKVSAFSANQILLEYDQSSGAPIDNQHKMGRAILIKDRAFEHEREHRIAIITAAPNGFKPVLFRERPAQFRKLVKRSVADFGSCV